MKTPALIPAIVICLLLACPVKGQLGGFERFAPNEFSLIVSVVEPKLAASFLETRSQFFDSNDVTLAGDLFREYLASSEEHGEVLTEPVAQARAAVDALIHLIKEFDSLTFVVHRVDNGQIIWTVAIDQGSERWIAEHPDELDLNVLFSLLSITGGGELAGRFGLANMQWRQAKNWILLGNGDQELSSIQERIDNGGRDTSFAYDRSLKRLNSAYGGQNAMVRFIGLPSHCRAFFPNVPDKEWEAMNSKEISALLGAVYHRDREVDVLVVDAKAYFTRPLSGLGLGYSYLEELSSFPAVPDTPRQFRGEACDFALSSTLPKGAQPKFIGPHPERTRERYVFEYENRHGTSSGIVLEKIEDEEAMEMYVQMLVDAVNQNRPGLPYVEQIEGGVAFWAPRLADVNAEEERRIDRFRANRAAREAKGEQWPEDAYEFTRAQDWEDRVTYGYAIIGDWYVQADVFDIIRIGKSLNTRSQDSSESRSIVESRCDLVRASALPSIVRYCDQSYFAGEFRRFVDQQLQQSAKYGRRPFQHLETAPNFLSGETDLKSEHEDDMPIIARCLLAREIGNVVSDYTYMVFIEETHIARFVNVIQFGEHKE